MKTIPAGLKAIQPYMRIAEEHDQRDQAIAYWCRYYAVQLGLKINDKGPESTSFLISVMDWLENLKKLKSDDEINNDVVAQAHIENYALKIFLWADGEDRSGKFTKNVVKAFYTAGFIYDIVNTFGEPSEEVLHHKKYAKWKSTYIHNCLKDGIEPIPGPVAMEDENADKILESQPTHENSKYVDEVPEEPPNPFPIGFNISGIGPSNVDFPQSPAFPSLSNGSSEPIPLSTPVTLPTESSEETISDDVALTVKDYHKAQKLCKSAESALRYEDVASAIQFLQKALNLLTLGKEENE